MAESFCLVPVSSYLMAVFYVFGLFLVACLMSDGKKRVGNK